MDKLSEYLPLLIIVVSLIFTVIGRKKKSSSNTQETTLPWETEEDSVNEWQPPRTFTGSYKEIVEEKPKKQVFQKPAITPDFRISSLTSSPIIIESEEEGNISLSFEEEDIKRAIIYSEIINRKEY